MELRHFKCPSCGANLDVNSDSVESKCDYCGQSFVIDNPNSIVNETITEIINETIEETNKKQKSDNKMKTALVVFVATFVLLITITTMVLVVVTSNGSEKNNESNEFSTISATSAEIPSIVVEKDYYTFRTESVRQLNYDKNGIEMGFSDPEAYEAGANEIIDDPDTLTGISNDGARIYYNEEKNFFVELYADGALRLFFIPEDGKYFFDNK